MEVFATLEQWALGFVGTPWFLLVLFAFIVIDAVFPPIPSESLLIGGSVLVVAEGGTPLWLVAIVAAAGALVGDVIAYHIGALVPAERFSRRPRLSALMTKARGLLDRRAILLLVGARFVPVGRVAVNMAAGSVGFPVRRFVSIAAISAVLWATYSVLLGFAAAVVLGERPLLAATVGIAGGIGLGVVSDVAGRAVQRRWARRRGGKAVAAGAAVADERSQDGAAPAGDRQNGPGSQPRRADREPAR